MIEEGLISIVVPVFERAALLREAVASALAQTYDRVEVLVVDDASRDDTAEVGAGLEAAHPGRVRFTRREANGGPGASRETARRLARGEFLQYLDSDDLLHPRKLEKQVAALRATPSASIATCGTREYADGDLPSDRASARTGEDIDAVFPALLGGRLWQTVTPLFRRSLTDAIGPWTELRVEEDWEYDARAGALGARLVRCPELLADFRHHGGARASGRALGDPKLMSMRAEAHRLIHAHALRAAVPPDDPYMQRWARELFLLARQCGAAGLARESRELFALARAASGGERARGVDFIGYRIGAGLVGWVPLGKVACWMDDLRGSARERSRS